MPSPFPGMDPYLEGHLWPDVHHNLASAIQELIIPQISPGYVARVNPYTVVDTSPEEEVGIMYPDVEVLLRKDQATEPEAAYLGGGSGALTPPTLSVPEFEKIQVRIPVVEIRDSQGDQLITAIEILSPINKRGPGLAPYQKKRERLHKEGIHLIEIDLIRRGKRPFYSPYLPKAHYMATLTRAASDKMAIWAIDVKDALPTLPVPLKEPDDDVRLDLGKALQLIYGRNQYDLSINYQNSPPPPEFSEEDNKWMKGVVAMKKP